MKPRFMILPLLIGAPALFGGESPRTSVGLDVAMPYLLTVDGSAQKARGNLNLGVDGRRFIDENVSVGGRFGFDLHRRGGSPRQVVLTPGVAYRWMPEDRFSPYVRGDVPVILRGAANTAGSSDRADFGVAMGLGVAWDLGGAIGVPNALIRYDFDLQYTFGVGRALPVLALELFKFGIDYRF